MLNKNPAGRTSRRPARALTVSEVEQLISEYTQNDFTPEARDAFRRDLWRDLNQAIEQFNFRRSYRVHSTPIQFRKRFDELRASLRQLKVKLPPADQQNDLFNYIRRLGEAYAAEHGPHSGIERMSSSLPSLTITMQFDREKSNRAIAADIGVSPDAVDLAPKAVARNQAPDKHVSQDGNSTEENYAVEMPPDFNSAQRLRELIQSVDQVYCWMENYSEDLIPKSGWSKLEKIYGRAHFPELWLVGKRLPAIFDKHSRHWKGGRRARGAIGSRCDSFVVSVLNYAGIKTNKRKRYDPHTVEKYRRRARRPEGFELTADKLD
jgi:hypothetical protein